MKNVKVVALILALAYLGPQVSMAAELTEEQFRLRGLRAFKIVIHVGGQVPVNADELKKEVEVFLRLGAPDILLVEKNYDAFLVVTVSAGYAENLLQVRYGHYGVLQTSIIDWAFQNRHLNDVLSKDKDDYIFLAHIWKRENLFYGEHTELAEITNHVKDLMRSQLRDMVQNHSKANPQ